MKVSIFAFLALFISMQAQAVYPFSPSETVERKLDGVEAYESDNKIIVLIDGYKIQSIEQLHQGIAEALHYPAWYGKNLDALYDALSDTKMTPKEADITIVGAERLKLAIGAGYVQRLVDTINDAHDANSFTTLMYWQ